MDNKNNREAVRSRLDFLEHSVVAWGILALSLLLTFFAWRLSNRYLETRVQDRFAFQTEQIKERIEKKMLEYEQVLRGGVGLYEASDNVSRDEWSIYVENCEVQRYYPGIQGIGVTIPVPQEDLAAHEAAIRAEGFAEFRVFPEGKRSFYTSIIYIEPFDWRNKRAFGYDMYTEPVRRAAMDRAIDTGMPTISGMITLKQETENDVQHGFIYYLPMYRKGAELKNAADRRRAFSGFVYSAFRANDLMNVVRDSSQGISFEIYDAVTCAPEHLLYDGKADAKAKTKTGGDEGIRDEAERGNNSSLLASINHSMESSLSANLPVTVGGRKWTVAFEADHEFAEADDRTQSLIVAFGGLTVDVLLFFVIAAIGQQKRRAVKLARQMTREARESERLTRSILENATEAIIAVTQNGTIDLFNEAAETMFRLTSDQAVGNSFRSLLCRDDWPTLLHKTTSSRGGGILMDCLRACGDEFPCKISLGSLTTGNRQYYVIVAHDESERIESENKFASINQQLIDASHKSGMAEVATGVLHNVGNILNSLNVSSDMLITLLMKSQIPKLQQAALILIENQEHLADFLVSDERGKNFVGYLAKLTEKMAENRNVMIREIIQLRDHIQHINQIIRSQQDHASPLLLHREEDVASLMEDAVRINRDRNVQFNIHIERQFGKCSPIRSDRHKILQILVNLIKNAHEAATKIEGPRVIKLITSQIDAQYVQLVVEDNGIGIAEADLKNVLQFGYTTKQDGHGFGLHSCLIAAKQIGGELTVESEGVNCGARFTLKLPVSSEETSAINGAGSATAITTIPAVNLSATIVSTPAH